MTEKSGVISLVLGVIAVVAILAPIPVGYAAAVAIVGLVAGIPALRRSRDRITMTGASLNSLVLLYFLVGFALFAILP